MLKIFTYNLRTDYSGDGINAFSAERSKYILETFPKYDADIIGFQEVRPHMRRWLIENFKDYDICGTGRGVKLDDESVVIAYKKSLFDLVSLDTFWLSDTPSKPGSRFSTDQSSCPRVCTVVTLHHLPTGRMIRHYNTHLDHEGRFAQAQGISLILNRIAADYAISPMPVILTGDFNVLPDSKVIKSVLKYDGCGKELVDLTDEIPVSFHGYTPEKRGEKIDYIFTNLPSGTEKAFAATDNRDGIYLSDHYPLGATVEI